MTKQRHILLWAILGLLVASCTNLSGVSINRPDVVTASNGCDLSVQINDVDPMLPGETVFLTLNTSGFDWEYSWSATAGKLKEPNSSSIQFTAPEEEQIITVSVEVVKALECSDTNEIEIKVENPEVLASENTAVDPTATIAMEPSITPTVAASPTVKPSLIPEPTPLPEPTATPTLTITLMPTVMEQPKLSSTSIPNISVALVNAENRSNSFNLSWTFEGTLEPDMYFAVRVGRSGEAHSRFWGHEPPYEFSLAVGPGTEFGEGDYEWYVVVVLDLVPDGSGADGKWQEITRSNTGTFHVPFIPTPNPSSPPPLP